MLPFFNKKKIAEAKRILYNTYDEDVSIRMCKKSYKCFRNADFDTNTNVRLRPCRAKETDDVELHDLDENPAVMQDFPEMLDIDQSIVSRLNRDLLKMMNLCIDLILKKCYVCI